MRWVFLLLVMLNAFYYVWHQQEAPLKPKEVAQLSSYKGGRQDIRLLSESPAGQAASDPQREESQCMYLGGDVSEQVLKTVEQRLISLDIQARFGKRIGDSEVEHWVRIAPESRRLVDDSLLERLRRDFPQLKSEIMSCEGIATSQ